MKLEEVLDWLSSQRYDYIFNGDGRAGVDGFSSLLNYRIGSLTWVKKEKNYNNLGRPKNISCAVVQNGVTVDFENAIFTEHSKEVFFAILHKFWGEKKEEGTVGDGTVISEGAEIDSTAVIGCNCSIGGNVRIGAHTVIENNVSIQNSVTIGKECVIHSGTVIGKDGFGFAFNENNVPVKVPHFGGVFIGDRVEIGANCTVDRGTIDDTIIKDDVKVDSLSIIAHNVEVEEGTMILGGVTIGGSCKIGKRSYIAPQAIIKNQINVGNNSFVGMGELLNDFLGDNKAYLRGKVNSNKNYRRFL